MPKHGPAVIGREEYDRQLAEEAGTVDIGGQRSAKYGPRVLDGAPAAEPELEAAPELEAPVKKAKKTK